MGNFINLISAYGLRLGTASQKSPTEKRIQGFGVGKLKASAQFEKVFGEKFQYKFRSKMFLFGAINGEISFGLLFWKCFSAFYEIIF